MTLPDIADIYGVFEALNASDFLAEDCGLGGKLILYPLLDADGAATALGSSIAGAASLGLDPDTERVKQAARNGACDFVVNHLDEALRILKNEIRKKQPVAVGLVGDVAECLDAMLVRGVQPDVLAFPVGTYEAAGAQFLARGARVLGAAPASSLLDGLEEVWWSVAEAPARWLPKLDGIAVEVLSALLNDSSDKQRLLWLGRVPPYLMRVPEHYVKFSIQEADQFLEDVELRTRSGLIAAPVTVRRRGADGMESVVRFAPS